MPFVHSAPSAGVAAPYLELPAGFATKPSRDSRTAERYELQGQARAWLCTGEQDGQFDDEWHRLYGCHRLLRRREDGSSGVDLLHRPAVGRAYYSGLQTCGSAWACPVCAGVVWDHRKEELRQALEVHRGRGGAVLFITLTASHHHLPLRPFLDALGRAVRRVYTGGTFTRLGATCGYQGAIRGTEVTWSPANGWHPHYHMLWLCDELTAAQLAEVRDYVDQAWRAALKAEGLSGSIRRATTVKESSWSIEQYMAKIGHDRHWDADAELTMGTRKAGRRRGLSPHDMLRIGVAGIGRVQPARAAELYREYAAATKGRHSLRWSAGLRELLGLAAEISDSAVADGAANELDCVKLMRLTPRDWRTVIGNDARAELLNVAAAGDMATLGAFVVALGLEWTDRPHPVDSYMDEMAELARGP